MWKSIKVIVYKFVIVLYVWNYREERYLFVLKVGELKLFEFYVIIFVFNLYWSFFRIMSYNF